MRFLADENFNNHIFRGLKLQLPDFDIVRAQDVGLSGRSDEEILRRAVLDNRLLLTHDVKTIPAIALSWLQAGTPVPGIFLSGWKAPVAQVLADLFLIIECSNQEEWEG